MQLMGIDVGTTGVKAAIFDENGNLKGYGFCEYGILYGNHSYAEQDAEMVWKNTMNAIKQAVSQSDGQVDAISISAQGDAVIPGDRDGNALAFAQLGMDYRGKKQTAELIRIFGMRELFDLTGMRPHPMNSLIKILWAKEEEPNTYEKSYKYLTYADFILHKLGSDGFFIDYSMASRTMAMDIHTLNWSDQILTKIGIEKEKLSTAVPSGTAVGTINSSIADQLGIKSKALLVSGGHDQPCAALGAGILEENMALDSHGTAEVVSTAFCSLKLDDVMFEHYYPCYCHVVPNMYFTFSLNHTGGLMLKWYKDNLGYAEVVESERIGERAFEQIVKNTKPGPSPLLVLPHFNGSGTPTCDLESKGAILGLTMQSTRHDIVKAIMDSLAYEMRLNLDMMKKAGIKINTLRCVGGGARSPIDLQLKADVTGLQVSTLKTREAACLGAAILAGIGVGAFENVFQAKNMIQTDTIYYPNEKIHKEYDKKYCIYKGVYDTIKEITHQL